MMPFDNAADLLVHICPVMPQTDLLTVRPYVPSDKRCVYEICRKTCDDGSDGTDVFPDHPDLLGDRLIGSFLELSADYCFVIEDAQGVCGYVVAALDSKDSRKKMEEAWLPSMKEKYPQTQKKELLSPAEEMVSGFHCEATQLPESLYLQYPSVVRIDALQDRISKDPNAVRRALSSAIATLKVNGSHGLHAQINVGDQNTFTSYTRLGFHEMTSPSKQDDVTYLVRVI